MVREKGGQSPQEIGSPEETGDATERKGVIQGQLEQLRGIRIKLVDLGEDTYRIDQKISRLEKEAKDLE